MGETTQEQVSQGGPEAATSRHLFTHVARRTFAPPSRMSTTPSAFVHSSILYMTGISDYHRPVEAAARAAGFSVFHFIRRFRRETGMTPGEFLLRYRIVNAMNLLSSAAVSIAAIGRTVGYRDAASFSRAFLKVAGTSPRAYRRAQRRVCYERVMRPPERRSAHDSPEMQSAAALMASGGAENRQELSMGN